MIKLLDLQTDLNLSVVLLSSDLPLASPCEERPLASPCGANNPPPAAAAACQSIIVIFGENKQKQSADKRKITHCFILIKISTMQAGLEILVLCESYLVSGFAHFFRFYLQAKNKVNVAKSTSGPRVGGFCISFCPEREVLNLTVSI